MTPLPNSPPMMNAAFFMPGITVTHSARFQRSSGMPVSGAALNSRTIAAASLRRFASDEDTSARTAVAHDKTANSNAMRLNMAPPMRHSTARSARAGARPLRATYVGTDPQREDRGPLVAEAAVCHGSDVPAELDTPEGGGACFRY